MSQTKRDKTIFLISCKNMGNRFRIERLMHNFRSRRLLFVVSIITVHAILSQFLAIPFVNHYILTPSSYVKITSTMFISVSDFGLPDKKSQSGSIDIFHETADLDSNEEARTEEEQQLLSETLPPGKLTTDELAKIKVNNGTETEFRSTEQRKIQLALMENDTQRNTLDANLSLEEFRSGVFITDHSDSTSSNRSSATMSKPVVNKRSKMMITISSMKTLLIQGSPSSDSKRPRQLSARDKELAYARIQIENAPIIRDAPTNYASLFRNYSTFIRSYELMEQMLRVYIYKEGQKPIFHYPHLKGIYSSEGWFMKLMERNSHYVVRDPSKAHLFYLPFSSRRLRSVLYRQNLRSLMGSQDLENYVQIIASKYKFWNRTNGADHFLVACHDWALRFTNKSMRSCIRAICNSNLAKGFKVGRDVSLPVTMVPLSSGNPLEDLGGSHYSDRHILAFFSGSLHGDLRPILIEHWSNKEPDMKIFGPLGHDETSVARYRAFMKNSKYCICAKGYQVHTPRVIESIYYECVPVIIADNYVPPLFDVFEWESFAVFVLEEDIPNLRNILLSIPESKYIEMQNRVKMVQQHFLWHEVPVKYDLFHMILHSIWSKRVFQVQI